MSYWPDESSVSDTCGFYLLVSIWVLCVCGVSVGGVATHSAHATGDGHAFCVMLCRGPVAGGLIKDQVHQVKSNLVVTSGAIPDFLSIKSNNSIPVHSN